MNSSTKKNAFNVFRRIISAMLVLIFSFGIVIPPDIAQAQVVPMLPLPGTMVATTPGYMPALIKGITIDPQNPLAFDFIIDTGDSGLDINSQQFRDESLRLVKYFMAAMTVPADEMWVNLSPYEQDRMIPQSFGMTDMGLDLLAQDYVLKQLTASLVYPEEGLGKTFWSRIYEQAQKKFGTTDIPVDSFHKVWIVPSEAAVYEQGRQVFVIKNRLKVMMEEDYLALRENAVASDKVMDPVRGRQTTEMTELQTQIMREVVLPAIEKEVNEGQHFARLRQIYQSMILATWYKTNLKESLLGQVYADQKKLKGVDANDPAFKDTIYQQYVKAFETGVYNYIKEDYDPQTRQVIPRQYFSGGTTFESVQKLLEAISQEDGMSPEIKGYVSQALQAYGSMGAVRVNLLEEYLRMQEDQRQGTKLPVQKFFDLTLGIPGLVDENGNLRTGVQEADVEALLKDLVALARNDEVQNTVGRANVQNVITQLQGTAEIQGHDNREQILAQAADQAEAVSPAGQSSTISFRTQQFKDGQNAAYRLAWGVWNFLKKFDSVNRGKILILYSSERGTTDAAQTLAEVLAGQLKTIYYVDADTINSPLDEQVLIKNRIGAVIDLRQKDILADTARSARLYLINGSIPWLTDENSVLDESLTTTPGDLRLNELKLAMTDVPETETRVLLLDDAVARWFVKENLGVTTSDGAMLGSVQKRHDELHRPWMQELLRRQEATELPNLLDRFWEVKGRREDTSEIESKIAQVVDAINYDRRLDKLASDGKITRPETFKVEEFVKSSEFSDYLNQAENVLLEGKYVPQFIFAGKATRLNRGAMYSLDVWDIAVEEGSIQEDERSDFHLGMGPRQLLAYRMKLMGLAKKHGVNAEEVLKRQYIVMNLNDEVESIAMDDLIKNNFYGFDPSKMMFLNQPEFSGYRIDSKGQLFQDEESPSLVYGHGDNAIQFAAEGEAYQISSQGQKEYLEKSVLEIIGDRYIGTHRVNDLTKWDLNTVVDVEKLALSLKLQDDGHRIVADLVANPKKQKGGTASNVGLIETLAVKGSKALTEFVAQEGKRGAPYNAFRLVYKADTLLQMLKTHRLNYYLRVKDGFLYLESVTGDLTQFEDSNTAFVQKEDDLIHDFKNLQGVPEALVFLETQDEQLKKAGVGEDGSVMKNLSTPESRLFQFVGRYLGKAVSGADKKGWRTRILARVKENLLAIQESRQQAKDGGEKSLRIGVLPVSREASESLLPSIQAALAAMASKQLDRVVFVPVYGEAEIDQEAEEDMITQLTTQFPEFFGRKEVNILSEGSDFQELYESDQDLKGSVLVPLVVQNKEGDWGQYGYVATLRALSAKDNVPFEAPVYLEPIPSGFRVQSEEERRLAQGASQSDGAILAQTDQKLVESLKNNPEGLSPEALYNFLTEQFGYESILDDDKIDEFLRQINQGHVIWIPGVQVMTESIVDGGPEVVTGFQHLPKNQREITVAKLKSWLKTAEVLRANNHIQIYSKEVSPGINNIVVVDQKGFSPSDDRIVNAIFFEVAQGRENLSKENLLPIIQAGLVKGNFDLLTRDAVKLLLAMAPQLGGTVSLLNLNADKEDDVWSPEISFSEILERIQGSRGDLSKAELYVKVKAGPGIELVVINRPNGKGGTVTFNDMDGILTEKGYISLGDQTVSAQEVVDSISNPAEILYYDLGKIGSFGEKFDRAAFIEFFSDQVSNGRFNIYKRPDPADLDEESSKAEVAVVRVVSGDQASLSQEDLSGKKATEIADLSKKQGFEVEQDAVGGIDLNPNMMDLKIKRDGRGVPLPMSDQSIEALQQIEGFLPVIINVTPIQNLPMLLGLDDTDDDGTDQDGQNRLSRLDAFDKVSL